ncbi:DUF1292 domain-containing protein [Paenibacillus allorhizosphaerae]|uniref:DUF1292 domain-containing protein n=1 Tax=Paenibacillus allorhizosphaerae TaxID=2849866 RepID=A0ABN7TD17_9BACL|nr:DUF1292 domain-containing protein [Paenibacillus allorhizosphaerae]CAG7622076.1 hypothetical protein PAECIP111802_00787 [Paenibacillus allorhizosphaerae]
MSDHIHDASCDHDHDEDIFIVTDENGVEHEMVMVYTFEVSDQAYAVLLDRNDMEADGVIFRIEEEDGEAMLASIEDEDEWNRVVQIYNEIVEEQEQ